MREKNTLSDSEWKLMRKLWEDYPRTITELVADLKSDTGWSKHTVITMLSRLEMKGAVRCNDNEKPKRYYPVILYENAAVNETESFIEKVYGGSIGMMLSAVVGSKKMTKEDIDELYEILKKAEEGD